MAQWIGVNATRLAWETKVETASQRLVLLAIAKYADQDGTAFPSVESLCADTCLNRKTAFKVLKELQEIGAIVVSKRQPNNGNCYSICGARPKNGSTEIGTTKNGTTNIGTAGSTKNGTPVVPKTVHEEEQEESKEEKQKVVVPVLAREESAMHPTVEDFAIDLSEAEVTSTEAPKTENQPPLQGPSYLDPVPFDEIVAAYNRHMAHIGGKVRALEPAQTDAVVAFWECLAIELWKTKDDELRTRAGALEQLDHYFRHCAQDGFINGTAKRKPEYKGWIAKFDWLIRESTLRRMLDGGYAPSGAGKKEGR